MLTRQALASKQMNSLKKYLMKNAKNKFLDHNIRWVTHHIPFSVRSHIAKINWN